MKNTIPEPTGSQSCPCGTTRVASSCCLQQDGRWLKRPSNTHPPEPETGLASNGCYAAQLLDCDGGSLTLEHYISKSVLKQIDSTLVVEGMPWQSGDIPIVLSPNKFGSRMFCKRHNQALTFLDTAAGTLFSVIKSFHEGPLRNPAWILISGEDLERWMMKVLFGMFASGNVRRLDNATVRPTPPPLSYLRILFGYDAMPQGWGLRYFDRSLGSPRQRNTLEITPTSGIVNPGPPSPIVYGVRMEIMGLNLHLSLKQMTIASPEVSSFYYRPRRFYFGDSAVLDMSWEDSAFDQEIILEKG